MSNPTFKILHNNKCTLTENTMKLKYFVAVINTQKLIQQDKHMKTPNFWSNLDPGKSPGWGKPVVRELLLFSPNSGNYNLQQISKPAKSNDKLISSQTNSEIFYDPKIALEFCAKLVLLYRLSKTLKNVPRLLMSCCMATVQTVRKCAFIHSLMDSDNARFWEKQSIMKYIICFSIN